MPKPKRKSKRAEQREAESTFAHGFNGQIPPRKQPIRDPDGEGKRLVTVERRLDRLAWLHSRSKDTGIQQHHFDAGRRLQRDQETSQRLAIAQINGGGGRAGLGNDVANGKIMAATRFREAMQALPIEPRRVVEIIVLENNDIPLVASMLKVHKKAALPLLRTGLEILAKHYRMV